MIETEDLIIKVIEKRHAKETCTCDICESLIFERSCANSEELPKNIMFVKYYRATTGHYDWGNDSVDSIEHYDICSSECLTKLFESFKKEKINTAYINIDTKTSSCYKAGKKVKQSNEYWRLANL